MKILLLKTVADEWDLILGNVSITTDIASNIVKAMEQCKVKIHVRCMACAQSGNPKRSESAMLARMLGRMRSLVGFLHRSPTARAILRKTLEQPHISPLKHVINVSPLWNSIYDMLDRYLHIHSGICATLSQKDLKNNSRKDTLSQQGVADIKSVRNLCRLKVQSC